MESQPLDFVSSEVIENGNLQRRLEEIVTAPGRRTTILGMIPHRVGTTKVFVRIETPPEPIMLQSSAIPSFPFSLDAFRYDIMELAQKYATDHAEDVRQGGAQEPQIDDALLDAIESIIKEGTTIWMAKR